MRTLLMLFLLLGLQNKAELPPVFRNETEKPSQILPLFERPSQEGLRELENSVTSTAGLVFQFLSDVALQSTLMKGADLKAKDKLTEDFFRSSSVQRVDQIFFRKFFEHFPVRNRGTNLLIKTSDGTYFEANKILLNLERKLRKDEKPGGGIGTNSAIYAVQIVAKDCRRFSRGQWDSFKTELPIGTFEIAVSLLETKKERLLGDVPVFTILKTADLIPFPLRTVPPIPLEDKFPTLRALEGRPSQQKMLILSNLAAKGDTEAEFLLGLACEKGDDTPRNLSAAVTHLERAAQRNFPPALAKLGEYYFFGYGVERDVFKAGNLFVQASDLGDVTALAFLGQSFLAHADDTKLGLEYLQYAADFGDSRALTVLAERAFEAGDMETALSFSEQPLLSLFPPAALVRGKAYLKDDKIQAFTWLVLSVTWDECPDTKTVKERALPLLLKLKNELSQAEFERAFELVSTELTKPK